jgi:hypothetical protein
MRDDQERDEGDHVAHVLEVPPGALNEASLPHAANGRFEAVIWVPPTPGLPAAAARLAPQQPFGPNCRFQRPTGGKVTPADGKFHYLWQGNFIWLSRISLIVSLDR